MDDISALLGLGMDDEMQTQALADSLRGRKRAADFFGMSTVGNLANAAQAEQGAITEAAARGGALRKAMADREAVAEREAAAQAERASESQLQRDFDASESALERDFEREQLAGKGGKPLTQAQATAQYRADSFDQGLKEMEGILKGGYNPSGAGGLWDKKVNSSDWTRWAASEEGEQFLAQSGKVREALLRAATGAAAPDAEKIDYMLNLIPQPGESQETVKMKMRLLKENGKFLRKMAGANYQPESSDDGGGDEFDNMSDEEIDAELARRGLR